MLTCQRCGHGEAEHGKNGGQCSHVRVSKERIESGNPDDGVEIREDWAYCECPYLLATG